MKTKSYLFFSFSIISIFFLLTGKTQPVSARENVADWYIQNFDSEIKVNKDSTLDIMEKITADCGICVGKHGIFRILPEEIKVTGKSSIKTPVELVGITDFNGQPIKFSETKNRQDATVTWKIGDPNRTVQGVNYYKIRYRVKNSIRFDNAQFDELYWNLTGNFWDLEIDKFHGKIVFPIEVGQKSSTVDYYTGSLGSKGQQMASFRWTAPNVLEFNSTGTFKVRQGLTASVTFPKNIFMPYVPTFWEKYGGYFFFILPVLVFSVCLYFWRKYGNDPEVDKTVVPEYEIPGNLSPIELGMLKKNRGMDNEAITAEIVNLAVKRLVRIKEVENKILFFHSKDYEFEKISNIESEESLNKAQKIILNKIFETGNAVKLSSLKNSFHEALPGIQRAAKHMLSEKGLILLSGLRFGTYFIIAGAAFIGLTFLVRFFNLYLSVNMLISGLILIIFSFFMPKRTTEGAELNWRINGFKLFMETVDKHRAEFYEKENIFEKFLPYAIVFGITKIWVKKMKEIYGADYYATHTPAWYVGNVEAFNADSFSSAIDSLSSSIAANTSAPSGSGGGGGAGGGGGGGGGGGW